MPLLQSYTLGFIDNECKKIAIQFLDNNPGEYELGEIVRFFKKYKKKIFIDREKNKINYMVMDYDIWIKFLVKLGFIQTANAVCDILYDLEKNYVVDSLEYLHMISKAKIVDVAKEPRVVEKDEKTPEEIERLKRKEIRRLIKKSIETHGRDTMFHCTTREKLGEIFDDGYLKLNKPDKITDAKNGVYLSLYPFDWMHYITKETTVAGAMIEIDVGGLKLLFDEGISEDDWKQHPAYVCLDEIPVERFVSISVSTDEKPYSFDKYLPKEFEKIFKVKGGT